MLKWVNNKSQFCSKTKVVFWSWLTVVQFPQLSSPVLCFAKEIVVTVCWGMSRWKPPCFQTPEVGMSALATTTIRRNHNSGSFFTSFCGSNNSISCIAKILLARKDEISIPIRLCNVLSILQILMKFPHFVNAISKEPAARLSVKFCCNWLVKLVTMATPISPKVKDKNRIFTAGD